MYNTVYDIVVTVNINMPETINIKLAQNFVTQVPLTSLDLPLRVRSLAAIRFRQMFRSSSWPRFMENVPP